MVAGVLAIYFVTAPASGASDQVTDDGTAAGSDTLAGEFAGEPAGELAGKQSAIQQPGVLSVIAGEDHLQIQGRLPASGKVKLIELRAHDGMSSGLPTMVSWDTSGELATASIARRDGRRDRLFSRFQMIDDSSGGLIGAARWVDDVESLAARDFSFPAPGGIKGLQCIVDIDDALELGVKHAALNAPLSSLVDWSASSGSLSWQVDGEMIWFRRPFVEQLDSKLKRLTRAGVTNTLILYNRVPGSPQKDNPLIHPLTDLARSPSHVAAFNLADARGARVFRGAMEFLADRYSDPGKSHGWASGFVIGNEVQSHWHWYNLGEMAADEVVEDYHKALRIAHLAIHRIHPGIRIYASLDHHWTGRLAGSPRRSMTGRSLLESLNRIARSEGNFPWHVAFHPYPENLGYPRTWEDKTAPASFDAERITFKNIEVLPAYLRQERFLFDGEARRIILSEQGFHNREGENGDREQAAAYAYAYYRTLHTKGIDAFILHRHVDHPTEGLRLGLRESASDRGTRPGRKRTIYEVFRLADTDGRDQAFEFALKEIGIQNWNEIHPREINANAPGETTPRKKASTNKAAPLTRRVRASSGKS